MKVIIIGAGNVGCHLGHRFHEMGVEIIQVFSRKKSKAAYLAKKINTKYTTSLDRVSKNADIYMLAVHDGAIGEVAKKMVENNLSHKLIVHTSGATPQSVLSLAGAKRFGIFYPLQTFSPNRKPDFNNIPICVDANSKEDLNALMVLAKKTSRNVHHVSDKERAVLHVAAVFANNFTNHLFHISSDILTKNNLPFDLLFPLIKETIGKIENAKPSEMQTGPARRGDEETIKKHLDYLKDFPEYAEVYKILSKGIKKKNH